MLTKKQTIKLNKMVNNYIWGMQRTHKVRYELLEAWAERYRAIMEFVIQKQSKR